MSKGVWDKSLNKGVREESHDVSKGARDRSHDEHVVIPALAAASTAALRVESS